MTYKNAKILSTAIPILVAIALLPTIGLAFAAQNCDSGGKCIGTEELYSTQSFDQSGIEAKITIPNMTTSSNCDPSGNGFALIATWAFFANGEWIEIGAASGQIDGTCYDSEEKHYLAYKQDGNYYEFVLTGSISPGNIITYKISDTDNDDTWQAYTDGSQRASLIMDYDYAKETATGVESIDDDVSIPKTDIKFIREHDGSNWSYWTTNDIEYDEQEGFITQCTPAYKTIKVGIGGSETC